MRAGTRDHPSCCPTRDSYCLLDAHSMNFEAFSAFLESCGIAQAHAHSQPEFLVSFTGAYT